MNTLGKTLVAVVISIVIIATLIFTRDFGAPAGYRGEGFSTKQEAFEKGIGASYTFDKEIGTVEFDDGTIFLCQTKDGNIVLSYMFRNRQQTKYYFESCYVVTNLSKSIWHSSDNKTKTNYRVADAEEIISNCDNRPVEFEEYTVTINEEETKIRLYYNRVD